MLYNVKAGIIGLDDLGRKFAWLLKNHVKNLDLLAACGRTQNELMFAKNDLSLEYVYSDEKSLFENHDIDTIFVFSEVHLKPHHAIQAIEAGKHVFLLSPSALNVEDAEAVYKSGASHPSQKVMIGSKVRFSPILQKLKNILSSGQIGKVNHMALDSNLINGWNNQFAKPCGSIFIDTSMDEIDLCTWLLDGKIDSVEVKTVNDSYMCRAELSSGASLNLLLQPKLKMSHSYLNIYGEKGQITLTNIHDRSFKLYDAEGKKSDVFLEEGEQFMFSEYLQLHHFVNVIMGKQKALVDSKYGVDVLKLAVAFEKSKVLGEIIHFGDETKS